MARVAAVGLDAAEWWLVEQLMGEGLLPNLAALRERSVECRLDTGMAYRSELPWTQFLTGRTARDNDYWSTAIFEPSDYSVSLVGAYPGRPFFARDDLDVIAFDLPHSTIRDDVRGVQVTAWGAHSAQYPRAARPAGLLNEIDARFGVHPALDNDYDGGWHQPQYLKAIGPRSGRRPAPGRHHRVVARRQHRLGPPGDRAVGVTFGGPPLLARRRCVTPAPRIVHRAVGARPGWCARTRRSTTAWDVSPPPCHPTPRLVVFAVHGMQANANDVASLALLPELLHRAHFGVDAPGRRRTRIVGGARGYPTLRPPERVIWRQVVQQRFAVTDEQRRRRRIRLALPDAPIAAARRLQRRLTGRPRVAWELNTSFPSESTQSIERWRISARAAVAAAHVLPPLVAGDGVVRAPDVLGRPRSHQRRRPRA